MAEKPRFYDAKLIGIQSLTPTVKHFVLQYPQDADTRFAAGQFLMTHLEKNGAAHKKAYSIASPPSLAREKNQIELSIKLVEGGFVSTWFFGLKEGAVLRTSLPYGVFSAKEPLQDHLVFVGTGTGIAPLRAMIYDLFEKNCQKEIWLIFGNRYQDEILYQEEWESLARAHTNFHPILTISRGVTWTGEKAYVQEIVKREFAGKIQGHDFYGCGLVPMCQQLKQALVEMNVPKESIHFEQFT